MKKRILFITFILVFLIISVCTYTKLSPNLEPQSKTAVKKLVSVNIYSKSDPNHIITLDPKYDTSLISRYSKLLENQSPAKGEDGSDYEVIAAYSDGSQSFYGIDKNQSEIATLCDTTLHSYFAKKM